MQKYKIQTSWLEKSLVRVARYHRYGIYKSVKNIGRSKCAIASRAGICLLLISKLTQINRFGELSP